MPIEKPDGADGTLVLVVRRTIHASAERLFRAWTEPEQLLRWWGPGPAHCTHAELDLRVGGRYRIANAFPDGRVVWIVGEFERICPPHELVYSWRLEGSRVTVRFEGSGSTTLVTVLHERIASGQARDGHEKGWERCLDGLVRTWRPAKPAPFPSVPSRSLAAAHGGRGGGPATGR